MTCLHVYTVTWCSGLSRPWKMHAVSHSMGWGACSLSPTLHQGCRESAIVHCKNKYHILGSSEVHDKISSKPNFNMLVCNFPSFLGVNSISESSWFFENMRPKINKDLLLNNVNCAEGADCFFSCGPVNIYLCLLRHTACKASLCLFYMIS